MQEEWAKTSKRKRTVFWRFWVGGCLLTLLAGCHTVSPSAVPVTPPAINPAARRDGTREMAELLQSVAKTTDPQAMPILVNAERARMLKIEMESAPDKSIQAETRLKYAIELLNAGDTETAIAEFDRLEAQLISISPGFWKANRHRVRVWQATAYMRLAEQQNCCTTNTSQACLLPIRGTGIHSKIAGSTHAMQILEEVLKESPDDLEARWLLNIAAMTLGRYPEGVPAAWRIPPKVFQSDYDIKRFPNVASAIGLNLLGRSGGCVIDDLDGDGNLDILVSGIGFQDQIRFFHNNADGTFTERTREAGLLGETGGLNLIQADYDNDGHTDIFVLRGGWMAKAARFPCSLLRNNGDGTFSDVTAGAGLMRTGPTQAAVWLDYNNDGWLDLFVAFESGPGGTHPCALYRNNRDGTLTDVAHQAGVDFVGFVKGVVSADYDNDGYPDLFLSVMGGRNVLFHNNRDGTFTNVAEKAGVTNPIASFSCFFFDYDNDGWPDLFVVGYKPRGVENIAADYLGLPTLCEYPCLYHNNHDGTFTDVTTAAHLHKIIQGMGINYGDLDNDGYLDFYVGTGDTDLSTLIPNRMFRNADGRFFQEVTTSGDFGHLQKGHAIAFADINNDGQQDVFAQMGGAFYGDTAYTALFANPGHDNHWLTLKLEGVQTNRSAIGARIKVTVRTATGLRDIYKTVSTGGSFGSGPLRQEIGLGKALELIKVEIDWPVSRKVQILQGVAMDRAYQVKEDQDQAIPLNLKKFSWPLSP